MEREKEWSPAFSFLFWRGMVAACWVMLFFLFFFVGEAIFGSVSYLLFLYSVILSALIVAIGAVFVFRYLKKKKQKLEEKRKQ